MRIIVLLFSLLIGQVSLSQDRNYPKNYFGMYAGLSYTGFSDGFISNVPGNSGKFRLRTAYGFYGNIVLQREISIYTAFEFALKGALTKGTEESGGQTVKYVAKTNVTGFNLPVLFNYTPRKEWGIMLGPQLVYLITAKEPWYKSDFYKPEDYQENTYFKFNPFSVDAVFAFNFKLFTGVTLQLRYTTGLMPIVKSEYGEVSSSSILFFLGLNFPSSQNTGLP